MLSIIAGIWNAAIFYNNIDPKLLSGIIALPENLKFRLLLTFVSLWVTCGCQWAKRKKEAEMSFKELGGINALAMPILLVLVTLLWVLDILLIPEDALGKFILPLTALVVVTFIALLGAIVDISKRKEAWLWKSGYFQSIGPIFAMVKTASSIETGPVYQGINAALETLGFPVISLTKRQLDQARQKGGCWLDRQDDYLAIECCLYKPKIGQPSARVYLHHYYKQGSKRMCFAWFDIGFMQPPKTAKDGEALVRKLLLMANTLSAGLRH